MAGIKPGSSLEVGAGDLEGGKCCFEVETSLQGPLPVSVSAAKTGSGLVPALPPSSCVTLGKSFTSLSLVSKSGKQGSEWYLTHRVI